VFCKVRHQAFGIRNIFTAKNAVFIGIIRRVRDWVVIFALPLT
jgi:hypothetical protein